MEKKVTSSLNEYPRIRAHICKPLQAVEGRHGRACLLEWGMARLVSSGGGAPWQGLCLLEGGLAGLVSGG